MIQELLETKEYQDLMSKDFKTRHTKENQKKYGVWRWLGMFENKDRLISILDDWKIILDIGGALAPLMFGIIIDQLDEDIDGYPIQYHNIEMFPRKVDCIFSSHTLEHFDYPDKELSLWSEYIEKDGYLILHLPSIKGWAFWHPNVKKEHKWLFGIKEGFIPQDSKILFIDDIVKKYFKIEFCKYVGDNSILIIARK